MTVGVILQPTYLPWLGYFDMIDQANVYIILEDVQFSKRSWQQRNRLKTDTGPVLLTCPCITKSLRHQQIKDVHLDTDSKFYSKHLKTIELNYRRTKFFDRYIDDVKNILERRHQKLVDLNFDFINFFLTELKIDVEIIRSSTIPRKVNTTKQDVLVEICQAIGANTYLSPAGSTNYLQDAALFEESGIKLTFHSYEHPTYEQRGKSFIPQLSTLDLLFNHGPHSIEIIRSGRNS